MLACWEDSDAALSSAVLHPSLSPLLLLVLDNAMHRAAMPPGCLPQSKRWWRRSAFSSTSSWVAVPAVPAVPAAAAGRFGHEAKAGMPAMAQRQQARERHPPLLGRTLRRSSRCCPPRAAPAVAAPAAPAVGTGAETTGCTAGTFVLKTCGCDMSPGRQPPRLQLHLTAAARAAGLGTVPASQPAARPLPTAGLGPGCCEGRRSTSSQASRWDAVGCMRFQARRQLYAAAAPPAAGCSLTRAAGLSTRLPLSPAACCRVAPRGPQRCSVSRRLCRRQPRGHLRPHRRRQEQPAGGAAAPGARRRRQGVHRRPRRGLPPGC